MNSTGELTAIAKIKIENMTVNGIHKNLKNKEDVLMNRLTEYQYQIRFQAVQISANDNTNEY